jgi:hypothetical protein
VRYRKNICDQSQQEAVAGALELGHALSMGAILAGRHGAFLPRTHRNKKPGAWPGSLWQ